MDAIISLSSSSKLSTNQLNHSLLKETQMIKSLERKRSEVDKSLLTHSEMVWIVQLRMKMIMANDYGNIDEAYKSTYRIYLRGSIFCQWDCNI